MRKAGIIPRLLLLLLFLLIIYPLFYIIFTNPSFTSVIVSLRASSLFSMIFIFLSILSLLFILLIFRKIKPYKFNYKQFIIFVLLASLLFLSAAYTQSNYQKMFSEGVSFEKIGSERKLNFEGKSFLAPLILSNSYPLKTFPLNSEIASQVYKKEIYLKQNSDDIFLGIYASWNSDSDNSLFSNPDTLDKNNSKVLLFVNNNSISLDKYLTSIKEGKISLMTIPIPSNYLKEGKNDFIISLSNQDNSQYQIDLAAEYLFLTLSQSFFSTDDGNNWEPIDQELLIFVYKENTILFKTLFRLGFIFKILGYILLFFGVFGFEKTLNLISNYKKTFIFSLIYSVFVIWLFSIINNLWFYFTKIIAKGTYFLLKISFLEPRYIFRDGLPGIRASNFAVFISKDCSGIDGSIFFLVAFSMILMLFWKKLSFWKTALLFPIGLAGVFLVNILRVYLITLVGIFISPNFAINAFHTNIGFLLVSIYIFFLFYLALPLISKKDN